MQLNMARGSHGLGSYPRLEFAYSSTIYQGAAISTCLVWIHAKIVHTWRQTGVSLAIGRVLRTNLGYRPI
jgi:hypothetical protein